MGKRENRWSCSQVQHTTVEPASLIQFLDPLVLQAHVLLSLIYAFGTILGQR